MKEITELSVFDACKYSCSLTSLVVLILITGFKKPNSSSSAGFGLNETSLWCKVVQNGSAHSLTIVAKQLAISEVQVIICSSSLSKRGSPTLNLICIPSFSTLTPFIDYDVGINIAVREVKGGHPISFTDFERVKPFEIVVLIRTFASYLSMSNLSKSVLSITWFLSVLRNTKLCSWLS